MSKMKVLENRVRRTAERLGFEVSKSRATGLWSLYYERTQREQADLNLEDVCQHLEDELYQRKEEAEIVAQRLVEEAPERFPLLFGEED